MSQLLLLRGARQLLTLRGSSGIRRGAVSNELGIIEDGSILIRDGVIASIGSTRRIENLREARAAAEIDVNGAVVMPGFVDPGLQLSLASGNCHKLKKISDFQSDTLGLMRSCLQHGTLNVQVKAYAGDADLRRDFAVLRHLAKLGDQPVGMTRTWRVALKSWAHGDDESRHYAETLSSMAHRRLAQAVEVSPQTDLAMSNIVWSAAGRAKVGVNLLWPGGCSSVLANWLRHANPRTVYSSPLLSAFEMAVLLQSNAVAVFSAGREVMEETSNDSVRQLMTSGCPIALSTGYDSSDASSFSMQMTLALAVLRLRLTPEQAIVAATVNAAHAAGLGNSVGTLEVGKRADLIVLNVRDYREITRSFGINHVGLAIRDGKIVFNRTGWKVSAH